LTSNGAAKPGPPVDATSAALPARGGYARREVDLDAVRAADPAFELSLGQAFAPLLAALLPQRGFRVRELSLEYVAPERLGSRATYSARLGAVQPGVTAGTGQTVELSLLVSRGAWLCVRGRALLELEARAAHGHSAGGSPRPSGEQTHG
jgi:hypothetical protein